VSRPANEWSPQERDLINHVTNLGPLWKEGATKQALRQFIDGLVAEEREAIQAILDEHGFRLSLDPAAVRKIEYHQTRIDLLETEWIGRLEALVHLAESISGVTVLTGDASNA
jgi:hypothetical protein